MRKDLIGDILRAMHRRVIVYDSFSDERKRNLQLEGASDYVVTPEPQTGSILGNLEKE